MRFHLGCDFHRDKDGLMSYGPKTYLNIMVDNFKLMFHEKSREYSSLSRKMTIQNLTNRSSWIKKV
jgi:hypothetical protein